MTKNCSKIFKLFLYADDTSNHFISKSIQELKSIYNKELSYVTDWLNANRLRQNVKNSNLVLFRSTKKTALKTTPKHKNQRGTNTRKRLHKVFRNTN